MNILAASVTNASAPVLHAHLSTLLRQRLDKHINVDYLYVLDPQAPQETADTLQHLSIPFVLGSPKTADAQYSVDEFTHNWAKPTFYWLGQQKQKLIEYAERENYDAIFLCDSDLLLDRTTLHSLISTKKPVVSANFWTRWTPQAPPLPQCWQEHPYEFQGRGWEAHEHLTALAHRQLIPVGGLGACTLISSEAFRHSRYWPPLEALPEGSMWQGEDRTFCISAQRKHVPLYADGWPDVFHCYRPSDVERIPETLERFENQAPQRTIRRGDLVSAILTPVEMPSVGEQRVLANFEHHLRGRLGEMKIIPSLEDALLGMKPGEDKFVKLHFPPWYEVQEYADKTRTIRVRIVDVKAFKQHPALEESTTYASLYEM